MLDEETIRTHEKYLEYIEECYGEVQGTNAYRILNFLKDGNKNAIEVVSNNPNTSMTAYFLLPTTRRWVGIITGRDKILLVADNDIFYKYKDEMERENLKITIYRSKGKIERENLKITNLSFNRAGMVIITTIDGGWVDEEGNLLLDMGFVTDFGRYCLSENTPPYGELNSTNIG